MHKDFKTYTCCINGNATNKTYCETKFIITKRIRCTDFDLQKVFLSNLNRLQKEDFNRVKIPKFTFETSGLTVVIHSEYIKGHYAVKEDQRKIIYEDVVQHLGKAWTLSDYGFTNFLSEIKTNTLYAVDFQSYHWVPDMGQREAEWQKHDRVQWLKDYY